MKYMVTEKEKETMKTTKNKLSYWWDIGLVAVCSLDGAYEGGLRCNTVAGCFSLLDGSGLVHISSY